MDNLYSPAATDDFFSNGFHQFYNELQDDPDGFNCWATASPQYNDFYFTSSAAYHDLDSGYSDLKSSSDNSNYCSADEFSLNCAASERINCDAASIQYNDLSDLSDINYKELYNLEHNFEINLENFLLDNNCDNINSAPPDSHPPPAATSTLWQQTFQQLPAKTPLCNNLCENFLREDDTSANAADDQHKSPLEEYPDKADDGTCGYSLDEKKRKFPEEKQFICNYETCRKVYAKPAHLKAHLRRHVGDKPYICNWTNCTWRFSRSDELARHRRSHSGIKPYKCDYCVKCFSRSDHLSKHRRVHERKMAANKLKNIWVSLPKGRPGRKPKSSRGANNS